MRYMNVLPKLTLLMLALGAMAVVACGGGDVAEPEIVVQTVIVEKKRKSRATPSSWKRKSRVTPSS